MLKPEIRREIEAMITRFDAAVAAGKTMDPKIEPLYRGAKAAVACVDPEWLARAASEDARGVVTLAANGDISGAYRLI